MAKKIMLGLLLLSLLTTLGFVGLIAKVTWDQHQDTKDWQHTTLAGALKDVPPFLARNYIKADDKDAVQSWQRVQDLLTEMETTQGLDASKWASAEAILQDARGWQETYQLTSGEVVTQMDRLTLYLDTEQTLDVAYETPSGTVLQALTNRLYASHVEHPSKLNTVYLEALQTVATDYKHLAAFLTDTLPTLGTITDTTLHVSTQVTTNQTTTIRTQIKEQQLTKFPFLAKLDTLLGGSVWAQIMHRNQLTKDYGLWQEAKAQLEAFSRGMYYRPGDITTYAQALDAGLSVKVQDKEGFTVDEASLVDVILYQGTPVASDQYIKVGADVTVLLKETYVPTQQEPETSTETTPPTEDESLVTPDDGWDEDWGEHDPEADNELEEAPMQGQ